MNIGEVAARTGLPAKTIRYYEEIGLVSPAERAANGYRAYDRTDVGLLAFVKRARALGFTVAECRELLSLYQDSNRASADVKNLALQRIDDINAKIAQLTDMREALSDLAARCHGDDRPDCPILSDLAGGD